MTADDLKGSAGSDEAPPGGLSEPLKALWHDARGDWETSHEVVQDNPSPEASWVHAYLHRKEGDIGNARYWYRRAGRSEYNGTLETEWKEIAEELLSHSH